MSIQVEAADLQLNDVVEGMGTVVHINAASTAIVFDKPENELLWTHHCSADDWFVVLEREAVT